MGGLFRSPQPALIEPDPAAPSAAQLAAQSGAAGEAAARDARLKAVARARRGLPGTVATGERGVLDPLPAFAARKTLLGE